VGICKMYVCVLKLNNMKKILNTIAVILLFTTISCKKVDIDIVEPPTEAYFISFKADGVQKEFKKDALAGTVLPDTSGIYTNLFAAYQTAAGLDNVHISLLLTSRNSPNIPGTYQDPFKALTVGGNKLPQAIITYVDTQGADGYQSLGIISEFVGTPTSLYPNLFADAKVTITEATSTYFKGTFSATAFRSNLSSQKRVLTEGKFYLPRY
jgi:hypothetical protein